VNRMTPMLRSVVVGNIDGRTRWGSELDDVNAVVHLAARVHVTRDRRTDPLAAFRQVNVRGSARLAEAAAQRGVRRFVFMSSIKVHGEGSDVRPLREDDRLRPLDAYAVSKVEAEERLSEIAECTGLELVILRPPLVYGPGVKANFMRLLRAVDYGFPLPLGSANNVRSLVFVDNLADAVLNCLTNPRGEGGTFFVSDSEPVSTASLVRGIARALDREPRLLAIPPVLMRWAGSATGRGTTIDSLFGSLAVDTRRIRETLGWTPPYSLKQGLEATAEWYRARLATAGGGT
jgi:nucleoside-diphosphate-sugar epimerase